MSKEKETFRERVQKEARDFSKIYADFSDDLEIKTKAGLVQSNWLHLFGVPFNGYILSEQSSDEARRKLRVPHKHDAVVQAIGDLGVKELRLGALEIQDSRILAALEGGLFTPDDLVPPSPDSPVEFEKLVRRQKPDHGDPIFWRALLEVFCRAFNAQQGRRPWTLEMTIELAFDMNEIRLTLPNRLWNKDAVQKVLRTKLPYTERYPARGSLAGVGEDRIQAITDLIGPIDYEALKRLRDLFPDAFFKVADAREHRQTLNSYSPDEILDQAEALGDALSGSRPSSDS